MRKLDSILIILTFNAIFWSLINSVKNNKNQNELSRVGETSKDNDGAESSVNAQIQMLKPKTKFAKKGTARDKKEDKMLNKNKYMRIYYQNNKEKKRQYREKNKEKKRESDRKYREKNREKRQECARNYYQNNKEKRREYDQKYRKNNREKMREYDRKYRAKRKNEKINLQDPKVLGNVDSDNNGEGGTCNPQNDDFRSKGKLPIVYEDRIQSEEGNFSNQEEEETKTHMEEQNQTVVEEPTKINSINQIDSNEEYYLLDPKEI